MLKQIVFIYRDSFVCSIVEKKAKDEEVQCYATADLSENLAYIINDLRPEFVIVDEAVLSAENSQIRASLDDSNVDYQSVLLSADNEEKLGFDHVIGLPFDPMMLLPKLRSFLS